MTSEEGANTAEALRSLGVVRTGLAFLVALLACATVLLVVDDTPLLVRPSPNLDLPLGLIGLAGGSWSARRVTLLPFAIIRRRGWVLWIMLPLFLAFGLAAAGSRAQEALSFRSGSVQDEFVVPVVQKRGSRNRSGRVHRHAGIHNPLRPGLVELAVSGPVFDALVPGSGCVRILVERAANGAARIVRATDWTARCPVNAS